MSVRCALIAVVIVGALVGSDYVQTHRLPVERATVVAVRTSDHRISCPNSGRSLPFSNEYEQVATYGVSSPRHGLPSTFTVKGCPDGSRRGQVFSVVRVGTGADADVHFDPPRSPVTVAAFSLGVGVAVGVGVLAWFRVELWWRRRRIGTVRRSRTSRP